MNRKSNSLRRFISCALVFGMMLGMSTTVFAAQVQDVNTDGKINYVSIGASNANGYGMRGYLPNEYDPNTGLPDWENNVYEVPVLKAGLNIYGYQQKVDDSYPDLIADDLEAIFGVGNVERNELAMSSMRAEEVRFLIQDDNDPNAYPVDPYIKWRFYDTTGFNPNLDDNWFYFAGRQEYNRTHSDELPMPDASVGYANVTEEHFEKALAALRHAYQDYIATADLITLDIGMNNFGVFLGHEIGSNSYYGHDIANIDPELAKTYEEGKAFVMQLLFDRYEEELRDVPMDLFNEIVDVLAYALVSYCYNFDIIVERIRELNSDAMIVAVSVQNIMKGLSSTLPGTDVTLPYGEMLGIVINAANMYVAGMSANADEYLYADIMEGGHVEFFLDEISAYNGDPATISQNIRDSFDIYDTDLLLKFHVRRTFTELLSDEIEVEGFAPSDSVTTYLGKLFGQQIKIQDTPLVNLFFAKPEQLPDGYRQVRAIYDRMLNAAYDAMAHIMQEGAWVDTIDLFTVMGDGIGSGVFREDFLDVAMKAALSAAADPSYQFDAAKEYPSGILSTLAAVRNIETFRYISCAVDYIRTGIGNSFYGHPSENGQREVYNAITEAIKSEIAGMSVYDRVMGELEAEILEMYGEKLEKVTHLTYSTCKPSVNYVALGGIVTAGDGLKSSVPKYADLFADAISASGVEVNFTNLAVSAQDKDKTFNELNAQNVSSYVEANREAIAEADIITYNLDSTALKNVIFELLGGDPVNWEQYLTESEKQLVLAVVAKLFASLTADAGEIPFVTEAMIEKLAYVVVRHCIESMRAVEAIKAINPNADLIVIGMYNPFDGMIVDMDGQSADIGLLFDDIIEAADFFYGLTAIMNDITFVSAPDAEVVGVGTISLGANMSTVALMRTLSTMAKKMLATEAGHEYIAERLIHAVSFAPVHKFVRTAYVAPQVGVPGTETLECVKCGEVKITDIPALEEKPLPEIPSTPEFPGIPDFPEFPKEPEVPETPEVPDEPEVPETPEVPDIPEIPDVPETPDIPEGPSPIIPLPPSGDTDEPGTPSAPSEPIKPSEPTVPTEPEKPEPYVCDGGEACPSKEFVDLDPNAWYHLGVDIMLKKGIMQGVGHEKFAPDAEITRAELVTMLYRLEEAPAVEGELAFEDVTSEAWYADAVLWAAETGIVNGISETKFAPADVITREQIAVILARYAAFKGIDTTTEHTLNVYADASDISEWALDAMEWANETGLIGGTSETALSPKASGNRAQIAVILARFMEL